MKAFGIHSFWKPLGWGNVNERIGNSVLDCNNHSGFMPLLAANVGNYLKCHKNVDRFRFCSICVSLAFIDFLQMTQLYALWLLAEFKWTTNAHAFSYTDHKGFCNEFLSFQNNRYWPNRIFDYTVGSFDCINDSVHYILLPKKYWHQRKSRLVNVCRKII